MKPWLVVCVVAVATVLGVVAGLRLLADTDAPSVAGPAASEIQVLRQRVDELTARLDAMARAAAVAAATPERSNAFALPPDLAPTAATPEARDPLWYLDQYVRSFAIDAQGVEYWRLAVEAHVVELQAAIVQLVRDPMRPVALRSALAVMFGRRAFADSPDVVAALLAALVPPAPDSLAERALTALTAIGSSLAVPGLEHAVVALREGGLRERALALLCELAGDGRNAILLRLFAAARDDAFRGLLVRQLDGSDASAALDLLRTAAGGEQSVRLAAAQRVHEFDEPGFDALVDGWRPREPDPQVLAALGGPAAGNEIPGWSAMQATGAPDADPSRDDPKAWASRDADMGRQWLQLGYAQPMPAHAVRIFEVNSPGCVVEVQARGTSGGWTTVWSGTAEAQGSPLVLTFPRTAFAVRSLRLVLDTDRKPGWNEIDAVELIGPGGAQWAVKATASSSYASRGSQLASDAVQFDDFGPVKARR
jgi:hypothetical protein